MIDNKYNQYCSMLPMKMVQRVNPKSFPHEKCLFNNILNFVSI